MKNIILVILFSVSFSSCTKEVQLNLPKEKEQVVVNAFLMPDSLPKLNLSKSTGIYELDIQFINNASIQLFRENELTGFAEHLSKGTYLLDHLPRPNNDYSVIINVPGKAQLSARTSIPEKIPVLSMEKMDYYARDEDGVYYSELQFSFQEPGNEINFYEIKLVYHNTKGNSTLLYPFALHDKILIEEGEAKLYPNALPFSDKICNGELCTLTVNYYPPKSCQGDNHDCKIADENYRLILYFRSVSEEYYLYKKKLIHHLHGKENDFWDGFNNPVTMYSNVKNGLGIVAGYNEYIDTSKTIP